MKFGPLIISNINIQEIIKIHIIFIRLLLCRFVFYITKIKGILIFGELNIKNTLITLKIDNLENLREKYIKYNDIFLTSEDNYFYLEEKLKNYRNRHFKNRCSDGNSRRIKLYPVEEFKIL